MNAKQLANILVKMVGLDVCAHAAPTLLVLAWVRLGDAIHAGTSPLVQVEFFTASMGVPFISVVLGVFMILASRVVTNWLFETEPREP